MSFGSGGSRNFITTPDDHGGIALTVCTLLATWMVLCYILRVQQRLTVCGPFGIDDIVCGVASGFAVFQTIASVIAIHYGFGKSLVLLNHSHVVHAEKALYAAQLLYLVTNALTKSCVALILARVMYIKHHVRVCYGILAVSVLWGIGSVLAEGILCTTANPWSLVGKTCSDKVLAWQVITAFDVLIEVVLACMPLWLVWNLQSSKWRKTKVVIAFSLRPLVIIPAIVRVTYLTTSLRSSQPLLTGVIPFICLQVEMHYGLMAATFPCLKPFVSNFHTGWGTFDTTGVSGYGTDAHRTTNIGRSGRRMNSTANKSVRDHDGKEEGLQSNSYKNVTQVWANRPHARGQKRDSMGSSHSQSGIIRQTFTTEIEYGPSNPDARHSERSSDRENNVL